MGFTLKGVRKRELLERLVDFETSTNFALLRVARGSLLKRLFVYY